MSDFKIPEISARDALQQALAERDAAVAQAERAEALLGEARDLIVSLTQFSGRANHVIGLLDRIDALVVERAPSSPATPSSGSRKLDRDGESAGGGTPADETPAAADVLVAEREG